MPDSTLIFKPGFRVTDENGTPQSGATLEFYDAGTSNSRAVFTDSSLSTSAGSTVTCDAGGYPTVSDVKALLYTGVTAYKIIAKKSDATTLWSHDNILGALDTSSFLTGDVTAESPIVATSSDATLTATDKGKLYNVDCSGATVTITLLSAVTATDGFPVGIRHNGTANQVIIRTVSSQTIKGAYSGTSFTLRSFGEVVWITSDGAGWNVSNYVPPLLTRDISMFRVTDRRTSPPSSPVVGERYIVVGTPTGTWSSYAEHDVLEYDGLSGYIQYTPSSDCGWLAYIIDEDINVQYQGGEWVDLNNVSQTFRVLHVQESYASTTAASALTSGSWQTRALNTVVRNSISGASLASNQITLPIGSYTVMCYAGAYRVELNQIRMRNITDSTTDIVGYSSSLNPADNDDVPALLFGTLVLTESKTFEIQHQVSRTGATGRANSFGEIEVYADIIITQIKAV